MDLDLNILYLRGETMVDISDGADVIFPINFTVIYALHFSLATPNNPLSKVTFCGTGDRLGP